MLVPNALDLAFFTFILAYAATAVYAVYPDAAVAAATKMLMATVSIYLVGRLIISQKNAEDVIKQFIVATLISSAAMTYLLFHAATQNGANYWSRLSVEGSSAVGTAQPIPMALIAAVLAGIYCVARKKWLYLLPVVALGGWVFYIAVLTGTRGIFIAAGAGLIAAAVAGRRIVPWARLIGISVLAVVAIGLATPHLEETKRLTFSIDRLVGNFQGGSIVVDESARLRMQVQERGVDMFKDNPFGGVGIGNYDAITHFFYPHNLEIEIAAEAGIVGLLLLGLYLYTLFVSQTRIMMFQPAVGVVLLAMTASCFMHQQVSFAFAMAKPLFMFTGLTASALMTFRAPSSNAARTPRRRRQVAPGLSNRVRN
ncbi:O-antigen ligase family protein [Caulobacter sp. LARHSG274]